MESRPFRRLSSSDESEPPEMTIPDTPPPGIALFDMDGTLLA